MTEITGLSTTDSSNTEVTGESIDGAIANMGRMDNTLQAILGLLARSIRTNVLRFLDNTDDTKRVKLDLSGLPTATERTWTAPYYSGTLGLVSDIRGQIYGLTLSNNAVDITNDIDIAAGAAVDSTGTVSMMLTSAMGKQLDVAWAVGGTPGSPAGGRMSAAAIANTTYHMFLIRRPDTGVVDVGFDVSATAPTLPTNYTQFRRIGSIVRASGAIRLFFQFGNEFLWNTALLDVDVSNPGTSAVARTLSVPVGIRVKAMFNAISVNVGSAVAAGFLFSEMDVADAAASFTAAPLLNGGRVSNSSGNSAVNAARFVLLTNTSGQVRSRLEGSDGSVILRMATIGYTDFRDSL